MLSLSGKDGTVALTNYAIGGTSGHPGGTWTIQSTNSATVGRYHDLALLMEGILGAGGFTTSRPGVLSGAADSGVAVPVGMYASPTGSGLNINIRAGAAVVERTTLVGSYTVAIPAAGTVTLGTADATNPRIDRIDLQVLDGVLGDNGGVSLTQYVVTPGTAAGSPVAAAAPANSIPLSQVTIPANTLTLTGGMFADKRRSAALRGTTRVLLGGDLLTDPGYMVNEKRARLDANYGWMEDRWDPVAAVWKGTQRYEFAAPITAQIACTANNYNTVATIAVPDPGWAYYVKVSGQAYYSAAAANTCFAWITIDSAVGNAGIIAGDVFTTAAVSDITLDMPALALKTSPAPLSGAHTFRLIVDSNHAGNSGTVGATVGVGSWLDVEVIPA